VEKRDLTVRGAIGDALREAHWQRGVLADDYASEAQGDRAAASIVAAFLSRVPPGLDAGTLLVEVKAIANG
jgi:hypothetical protein